MARRKKKPVHHIQMTERKRAIIGLLLQEYGIKSAQNMDNLRGGEEPMGLVIWKLLRVLLHLCFWGTLINIRQIR